MGETSAKSPEDGDMSWATGNGALEPDGLGLSNSGALFFPGQAESVDIDFSSLCSQRPHSCLFSEEAGFLRCPKAP